MSIIPLVLLFSCCCCRLSISCGDLDIEKIIQEAEKEAASTTTTTTTTKSPAKTSTTSANTTASSTTTETPKSFPEVPAEKSEAVKAHNDARRKEHAANMYKLVWSDRLARLANAWAVKCKFRHGGTEDDEYSSIGQNIYVTNASTLNYTRLVEKWLKEKKFYDFDTRTCVPRKMCGHYTQVVWADSIRVGCGFQYCDPIANSIVKKGYLVVCNYAPSGNKAGELPFLKGRECSSCKSSCDDGLCGEELALD